MNKNARLTRYLERACSLCPLSFRDSAQKRIQTEKEIKVGEKEEEKPKYLAGHV